MDGDGPFTESREVRVEFLTEETLRKVLKGNRGTC